MKKEIYDKVCCLNINYRQHTKYATDITIKKEVKVEQQQQQQNVKKFQNEISNVYIQNYYNVEQ